eukprot:1660065-Amphidinium_carterae.2
MFEFISAFGAAHLCFELSLADILQSQPCVAAMMELLSVPVLQFGTSALGDSWQPRSSGAIPALVHYLLGRHAPPTLTLTSSSQYSGPAFGPVGAEVRQRRDLFLSIRLVTINIRTLYDSGKMKFVASQLSLLHADVVFVQETRLPEHVDLQHLDGFELFTSPAVHGHGGLMIMVRQDKLFAVDRFRQVSSRVLVVFMTVDSIQLRLVRAHAPIAEALDADHDKFAQDMQAALGAPTPGELVFVGCDLNARLASLVGEFQCVGPHAASSCPQNAVFRHSCLKLLDEAKLVASNTLFESDDPVTWQHPCGTEHEIDYIFVPQQLHAVGRVIAVEVGPRSYFDTNTTSDHRHVLATVVLTSTASRGKRQKLHSRVRAVDDAHLRDFRLQLSSALPRAQSAASYVQGAMAPVAETLRSTAPSVKPPKKPWLTDATWTQVRLMNKWRRFLTARRRNDAEACSTLFEVLGRPGLDVTCPCRDGCICGFGARYDAAVVSHIAALKKKKLRAMLRSDRRRWFDAACACAAESGRNNQSRLLHRTVKAICKAPEYRGSRLRNQTDEVVSDRCRVEHMWLEHWTKHFDAITGPAGDFGDRSIRSGCRRDYTGHLEIVTAVPPNFIITEDDVQKAVRAMPSWRATADAAPAIAVVSASPLLAAPLAELYNECLRTSTVLASYGGARLVPVWKKKGSAFDPAAYRPIALMLFEAKVFARICLQKLLPLLEHHHSQYGSGPSSGVTFPQAYVQQFAAFARSEKCSSATLFVDVMQAFDAVPLQMIWGTQLPDDEEARCLVHRGYTPERAEALLLFLQQHPAVLDKLRVPRVVIDLLRAWGSATWMVTGDHCEDAVFPHTGVPQGHNLSALLFDLFYSDLMRDLDVLLAEADLCTEFAVPEGRLPLTTGDCEVCLADSAAYRDDLAVPVLAHDADSLISRLRKVTEIVDAVHSQRFLRVNYARGKTECTIHLVGHRSKGLFQGLRMVGKAQNADGPAIVLSSGQVLRVAQDYAHLGRVHSQSGLAKKEITTNLALAASAFKRKKKVLTSTLFTERARLGLYQMYVVCHLLKNAAVTERLGDKDYHRLRSCYVAQVRKVLTESSNAWRVSSLTDVDLFAKHRVPTFQELLDRRRLQALPRFLCADSRPFRAVLASVFGSGSVWSGIFDSLGRLQQSHPGVLAALPAPSEVSVAEWCQFVLADQSRWRQLVRAHKCVDLPSSTKKAAASTDAAFEVVFSCDICGFPAKSAAGLAMHRRRVHEIENALSLLLRSAKCPSCGLVAATRDRALDHLRACKRCRVYTEANVEPMTREELIAVRAREFKVDHTWTRPVAPKPGPKPPGERPPLNGIQALFSDELHESAAVILS